MKDETESRIIRIILSEAPDSYDRTIAGSGDPDLWMHLSSLRRGFLGWFPFASGWQILQAGAAFGAITGTLLDSGARVDAAEIKPSRAETLKARFRGRERLRVFCRDIMAWEPGIRYDCVVLEQVPEALKSREEELFKKLSGLLKENGILITGLSGDEPGPERAGLSRGGFFRLIPNPLFPQVILSADCREEEEIGDRVLDFWPWEEERREVRFLGVFVKGELPAPVSLPERVYLSSDRGREASGAVLLYSGGYAEKTALYPEGIGALRRAYENLEDLKKRGLDTVPQRFEGNRIRMPEIKEKTLLWRLGEIKGRDAVISLFDRLRENMLLASGGPPGPDGLLREGFPDMIPFNIFLSEGKWLYFDQEFREKDCPPGYILFRMLYYSYLHVPELEEAVPLPEMKERYGIGKDWDAYAKREAAFLYRVRRMDLYARVWQWRDEAKARRDKGTGRTDG